MTLTPEMVETTHLVTSDLSFTSLFDVPQKLPMFHIFFFYGQAVDSFEVLYGIEKLDSYLRNPASSVLVELTAIEPSRVIKIINDELYFYFSVRCRLFKKVGQMQRVSSQPVDILFYPTNSGLSDVDLANNVLGTFHDGTPSFYVPILPESFVKRLHNAVQISKCVSDSRI